jgi:hypothetical protein
MMETLHLKLSAPYFYPTTLRHSIFYGYAVLFSRLALAGGDKPPPLQANLYLKSSGGVYPRPYWVRAKKTLRLVYAVQGFSISDLGPVVVR